MRILSTRLISEEVCRLLIEANYELGEPHKNMRNYRKQSACKIAFIQAFREYGRGKKNKCSCLSGYRYGGHFS